MQEQIAIRKKEDIEFLKEHDGESFICLKSQATKDGGWPAKHGSCAKLAPNKFMVYEGNLHSGITVEIGEMTAEQILETWWVD